MEITACTCRMQHRTFFRNIFLLYIVTRVVSWEISGNYKRNFFRIFLKNSSKFPHNFHQNFSKHIVQEKTTSKNWQMFQKLISTMGNSPIWLAI